MYDSPTASFDKTLNLPTSDTLSVIEMLSSHFSGIQLIDYNVQGFCSKLDKISKCSQTNVVFCCSKTWTKPHSILPCIFKPGAHSHRPCAHGFLKLL